jgi:hypothetical protein
MEIQKFNEWLHIADVPSLKQTYLEIFEDLKVCLSQVLVHGSSIGCFLFHLSNDYNKIECDSIVNNIRAYLDLYVTLKSQMKSIRFQLESKGEKL